jgi:hypothetical protein
MIELLAALQLIMLHRLDGGEVYVNPAEITTLVQPRHGSDPGRTSHPDARCLVHLSDHKFFAVIETCAEVRRLLNER